MRKIARPLLAATFVSQGVEALLRPQEAGKTARPALEGLKQLPDEISAKVPSDVESFARANALAQVGGGLLLASGKLPRIAAAVLACTVIPGSAGGRLFWSEPDPQRRTEQRRALLTDVSLIGGLMIAAADTAGKPSLGWRARRAAQRTYRRAASAFPITAGDGAIDTVGDKVGASLLAGVEHGRELAELVGEKAGPLLESAGERGAQFAEVTAERGTEFAQVAREGASTLADSARRGMSRLESRRR